jgi:hypothetical protein
MLHRVWNEQRGEEVEQFYAEDDSEFYIERQPKGVPDWNKWCIVKRGALDEPTFEPDIVAGPFDRLEDAMDAYTLVSAGI